MTDRLTSLRLSHMPRGGYVIENIPPPGEYRTQIAAFSTLDETLSWIRDNMVNEKRLYDLGESGRPEVKLTWPHD